jgi:hypothetical protein
LDKKKGDLQTYRPTSTRPGFRLVCQVAADKKWDMVHIDIRATFLQCENYDHSRQVIYQLPPEARYAKHIAGRLRKPAYGLDGAPRKWWNVLDESLRIYGLVPTRADRCCYVLYGPEESFSGGPLVWAEVRT